MAMRNIMLQWDMIQAMVAISKATEDRKKVSLRQTHRCPEVKDDKGEVVTPSKLTPIKQKTVCSGCGHTLGQGEIVSAYEASKDFFIEITDGDKESIKVPSNGALIIQEFCTPEQILNRPILFTGQSYFLTPPTKEKFPPTAFTVIREALKGDVAIARTVMYDREYTCLIRVSDEGLSMDLIRYPSEIRQEPAANLPAVDPAYVDMARKLKEHRRAKEVKLDYPDNYNEGFGKMVETKVAGQPLASPTASPAPVQTDNLKAMMEAMLAAAEQPKEVAIEQPKEAVVEPPKAKKSRKKAVA
jgi:Ku protein